jgi:hypothetical protein
MPTTTEKDEDVRPPKPATPPKPSKPATDWRQPDPDADTDEMKRLSIEELNARAEQARRKGQANE